MIRPKVAIKGDFQATEKLRAALKRARGSYVTVGVHEDRGSYAPTREQPNPPLVTSVAWWLEKGTKYMPPRPFLGPALDENVGIVKRAMAEGLVGIAFHKWTVEKGLAVMGYPLVQLVQNKINSNVGPALSGHWDPPSGYLGLKRKKGYGQRTLIATGLLFRSIAYKMHMSDGSVIAGYGPQEQPSTGGGGEEQDYKAEREHARQEALETKAMHKAQRAAHRQKDTATRTPKRKSTTALAHKAKAKRHGKR